MNRSPTISRQPKPAGSADPGSFHSYLDAFRTVAAVMVLVSHARDLTLQDYGHVVWTIPVYLATSLGHTGVVVFFVLSGYWISGSVDARVRSASFWTDYLIARLARLWVVLIPALILGGILDYVGVKILDLPAYHGVTGSHSLTYDVAARLTVPTFLANAFFLQTVVAPPFGSNGPLWSLSAEFWYYILFPAIIMMTGKFTARPWLAVLACLFVFSMNVQMLIGFLSWLVGVAVRRHSDDISRHIAKPRIALIVASMALLGIFAINAAFKETLPDLVTAIAFGAFLVALRAAGTGFPKGLEWVAAYGRQSSFSLYAIHFPILMLMTGVIVKRDRFPAGGAGIAVFMAITATCFGLAYLFSQLTERRTDKIRQFAGNKVKQLFPGKAP